MKFKNRFLIILAVFTLLFALAACGGGEEPAAEPVEETAAEPAEETAAEPAEETEVAGACPSIANDVSIEMWSPLTGPDGDEMSALAAKFSEENSNGITVVHVAQPEYIQKLNAAAAAQKLPAMTVVRVVNVAELAERNVLKPMSDDILAIFGDDPASLFPANAWDVGAYEGERYSFPLDMHPLVMYYNKDLFAAAGLEAPGTEPMSKEAFEAALEALHSDEVQAIAIGTHFNGATLFQSFIKQFGGELVNAEGTVATFDSEAGVQALTYINELKQKYSLDISGAGDPEANVFKQGKAAIVIHGPWHISDMQKLPFVGFAPLPQIGDAPAVWAGSHQLALTSDDPAQQAAAGCWIDWLSEHSVDWAKAGQVPARDDVRLGEELGSVAAPIAAVAPSSDSAILLPQVAELEGALWGQFGPVVDGVLMGEVDDIAGALTEAVGKAQQIIDENAERYAD